jgi:hypothetical protein
MVHWFFEVDFHVDCLKSSAVGFGEARSVRINELLVDVALHQLHRSSVLTVDERNWWNEQEQNQNC